MAIKRCIFTVGFFCCCFIYGICRYHLSMSFLALYQKLAVSYFTEVQCISLLYPVEQAVYNRPQPADKTRSKEGKDTVEAYQLAQRLQSMVWFGEGGGGSKKCSARSRSFQSSFSSQGISGNFSSRSVRGFIRTLCNSSVSLSTGSAV